MRVVMVSIMPIAGAAWETAKCLRKYANLDIRWICRNDRYPDGRVFPYDLLWDKDLVECEKAMRSADVIHIQNDHFLEDRYFAGKRVLVEFHSVPRRSTYEMYKSISKNFYTVRQPWLEREYPELRTLPNLIDVEEYTPRETKNSIPKVVFAPSNRWTRHSIGGRAKDEVDAVLSKFKDAVDVDSFVGVPYLENLARKKEADILIDDLVNNTWHKTTLEGCCFGNAVLTSSVGAGWLHTTLDSLERNLRFLLKDSNLEDLKKASRDWVVSKWNPREFVEDYLRAYAELLA